MDEASGERYLVTSLYQEVFSQIAILRSADADPASGDRKRVKVRKTTEGAHLAGYRYLPNV